jgi:hypothetical protein
MRMRRIIAGWPKLMVAPSGNHGGDDKLGFHWKHGEEEHDHVHGAAEHDHPHAEDEDQEPKPDQSELEST